MSVDSEPKGEILIVDDAPEMLDILTRVLERAGHRVRASLTGRDALDQARSRLPDLIVLDVNMPDMSGFDVCRQLKADPRTSPVPVLFVSGAGELESKLEGFDVGGVDYLTKPIQAREAVVRIRTHLRLREFEKEMLEANRLLEERVEERTAELVSLMASYERFVPSQFLTFLQKDQITEVELADQAQYVMSVMFTDIRDFTPLSEQMDPQENFNFLNSYLGRVSPVIGHHHGFVDKFLGDGIMALFPEHPSNGVDAAIALQGEVRVYNGHRASVGYDPVRIGSSLHTGNVILGIIGEEARMQGTVIADAVNLASRLENLTKLYGVDILISDETLTRLDRPDQYAIRFLDEVRVKGRREPVRIYEVFDGSPEDEAEEKWACKATYESALDSYRAGDFKTARLGFDAVLETRPVDRASTVFLDRLNYFDRNGVPDSWDGIQVFQH